MFFRFPSHPSSSLPSLFLPLPFLLPPGTVTFLKAIDVAGGQVPHPQVIHDRRGWDDITMQTRTGRIKDAAFSRCARAYIRSSRDEDIIRRIKRIARDEWADVTPSFSLDTLSSFVAPLVFLRLAFAWRWRINRFATIQRLFSSI